MSATSHINRQQFSGLTAQPRPPSEVPDMDVHEWGALMGHIATAAASGYHGPLDDLGPSVPVAGPPAVRAKPRRAPAPARLDRYEDLSPAEIAHRRSNKVMGIPEDYTDPGYRPM
jgi:hypothetical protein